MATALLTVFENWKKMLICFQQETIVHDLQLEPSEKSKGVILIYYITCVQSTKAVDYKFFELWQQR